MGSENPRGKWGGRASRHPCPAGFFRESHPSLWNKLVSPRLVVAEATQLRKRGLYDLGCTPREEKLNPEAPEAARWI